METRLEEGATRPILHSCHRLGQRLAGDRRLQKLHFPLRTHAELAHRGGDYHSIALSEGDGLSARGFHDSASVRRHQNLHRSLKRFILRFEVVSRGKFKTVHHKVGRGNQRRFPIL